MDFRVTGLSADPFQHLYGLSDTELARHGVRRYVADATSHYPCRIEMREAAPGETVLLLNHTYQDAESPYRGTHAIFVIEGATRTYNEIRHIPPVMRRRLLSLRGFDADGMLRDADVIDGTEVEGLIERLFANPDVSYIQAHNARHGCYSGRIDRI